jgi:hypothetical protein
MNAPEPAYRLHAIVTAAVIEDLGLSAELIDEDPSLRELVDAAVTLAIAQNRELARLQDADPEAFWARTATQFAKKRSRRSRRST